MAEESAEVQFEFADGTPAMVCTGARIHGSVKIGNGCVLHPKVSINAVAGTSIEIGENTVIEETVDISCSTGQLVIGKNCMLEVGCQVADSSIGSFSLIEAKAQLHNATVGENCCVGAAVVCRGEAVPANTSIFAPRNEAVPNRDVETHKEYVASHLAVLRKRLPKFQELEPLPADKVKPTAAVVANENSL